VSITGQTELKVAYGTRQVELRLPGDRCTRVAVAAQGGGREPLGAFREALEQPMNSPPLAELVAGRRVTVLVEDSTRCEPHEGFIRAAMPHLSAARSVTAVVATGSHARLTEGNRRIVSAFEQVATAEGVSPEVLIHDCHDDAGLTPLGTTSRGTPVAANTRALDCDVFLVNSGMKNHYFAGYSNALKALLPGICSYDAIEANHAMALDDAATFGMHPLHPEPARRVNPVAEDMLEAARIIGRDRPVFVLAAVTAGGRALWAGAGDMEAVITEGIRHVDRVASARVHPHSRLVVSPGGDPADETLYNAQRGLELARNAMREGAEVLFLAACPGGTAPTDGARENFFKRLTAPLDDVLRDLEQQYVLYSHKAYKFAAMLKRLRAIHMFTELDQATVAAAHMRKVDAPQPVLDRWLEESDESILIVEDANRLALYAQ